MHFRATASQFNTQALIYQEKVMGNFGFWGLTWFSGLENRQISWHMAMAKISLKQQHKPNRLRHMAIWSALIKSVLRRHSDILKCVLRHNAAGALHLFHPPVGGVGEGWTDDRRTYTIGW